MKYDSLKLGVEYAVIPAWQYSSKDKKDPNRVVREAVIKATIVNLDKYDYVVYRSHNEHDGSFVRAQKGSRSVGYLVKTNDINATFWLARPQDIVAEWASLEPRWKEEERLELERAEQDRLEREERELKRKLLEEKRQRVEKATLDSLHAILGNRMRNDSVIFDTRTRITLDGNYSEKLTVQFDIDIVEVLIETVLQAKEVIEQ